MREAEEQDTGACESITGMSNRLGGLGVGEGGRATGWHWMRGETRRERLGRQGVQATDDATWVNQGLRGHTKG